MSYGLQVYSAAGYVQIDETYANYSLIQAGTTTTNLPVVVTGGLSRTMVFVRIPYGQTIASKISGVTDAFKAAPIGLGATNFTYEYRVYRRVPNTPTPGMGLQVFDAGGALTFDSNKSYARILSAALIDVTGLSSSAYVAGFGSQPWIWFDPLYTAAFTQSGNPNYGYQHALCARLHVDNSVEYGVGLLGQGPPVVDDVYITGTRALLLAK